MSNADSNRSPVMDAFEAARGAKRLPSYDAGSCVRLSKVPTRPVNGKLVWRVELHIDPIWAQDGFDLDDSQVLDMLASRLGYANVGEELEGIVLAKPDPATLRALQGYDSERDSDELVKQIQEGRSCE